MYSCIAVSESYQLLMTHEFSAGQARDRFAKLLR
jgi:hypothetical protein